VLRFTEATIVTPIENLNLLAASAIGAKKVEIGVASEAIKGFEKLLLIPDRSTGAEIQRNASSHLEPEADRRMNSGLKCGRPAASGQSDRVNFLVTAL
jgi:hypothetical protein